MMSDYSTGDVAGAAYGDAGEYCVAVGDDVVDGGLSLITVRRVVVVARVFEYSIQVLCLSRTTDVVVAGRGGYRLVGIDWTEPSGMTRRTRPRKTDETTETVV